MKKVLFILILSFYLFNSSAVYCDNYLEESGMFEKLEWAGKTYYVLENLDGNGNCINDFFFPTYSASNTYRAFWVNTNLINPITNPPSVNYPIKFNSPKPFEDNKVLTFGNSVSGGQQTKDMYATSTNQYRISNDEGDSFVGYRDITFSIVNGKYRISGLDGSIESDNPIWKLFRVLNQYGRNSPNSNWVFNGSYSGIQYDLTSINDMKNYHQSYFYFNSNTNADLVYTNRDMWQNFRDGTLYSLYSFKVHSNSKQTFYDASTFGISNMVIEYGSSTGNFYWYDDAEVNPYSAYLIYGGSVIVPKWSIYYTTRGSLNPYIALNRYDSGTYKTTLYGNVASVVKDNDGVCYFVPPYTPSNYGDTYTIQTYLIPCSNFENEEFGEVITYPLLPSYINCGVDNSTYNVNITYKESVVFESFITNITNGVDYSTLNDTSYSVSIPITNTTKIIEVKANGKTRCYWDNSDTILGLDLGLGDNDLVKQLIGYPLILVAIGLSMVNPFVFVFVFVINDLFSLILVEHIFFLAISVGLMSLVANWNGERNFKTLIILCLLATAYLVQVSSFESDIAGAELTELSTITESIQTLFGGIGSSADLVVIITSVLPTFLLNLIVLILKLPAILISIIFASIGTITPLAITPLRYFEGALIVGAYVFIILKGYEMGRNMFRSV